MPVKMRLRRMGAKHQPSYRIVIADSRSPRDGRYIDQVGFYDPLTQPATIRIDKEKAEKWLRQGAQPTETVAILLKKHEIIAEQVRKPGASSSSAEPAEKVSDLPEPAAEEAPKPKRTRKPKETAK
jgi:small subunit ribosomal protein S16